MCPSTLGRRRAKLFVTVTGQTLSSNVFQISTPQDRHTDGAHDQSNVFKYEAALLLQNSFMRSTVTVVDHAM